MIIGGFSAYSRIIDWARFRAIADKVGAYLFVDMAHVAGLVAAGLYPNPVPHRRRRHQHHPQDPARPARRHHPGQGARTRTSTRSSTPPCSPASRAAR
jgi:hypothetical protein